MTEQVQNNARFGQLLPVFIAGLILVVNGFVLFWLSDIKADVRELRQNYSQVSELKAEIVILKDRIEILKEEITNP